MKEKAIDVRTKELITEALKKLLKKGRVSSISVNKITAECGVSRNTFYYHFKDIPTAIRWMFQRELPLSVDEDAVKTEDYFYRKLYEIICYVDENSELFANIKNSSIMSEFRKIYAEDVGRFFDEVVMSLKNEVAGSALYFNDLSHFLTVSSLALIESWCYGEIQKTPEELIEFMQATTTSLLKGVAISLKL